MYGKLKIQVLTNADRQLSQINLLKTRNNLKNCQRAVVTKRTEQAMKKSKKHT